MYGDFYLIMRHLGEGATITCWIFIARLVVLNAY